MWSHPAVNRHLEITVLNGCQRFDTVSTAKFRVYKFWNSLISSPDYLCTRWILNFIIIIWSMVNLEQTRVFSFMFYRFLDAVVNLDLGKRKNKTKQNKTKLDESSTNFIYQKVNWWWILIQRFWWRVKQRFCLLCFWHFPKNAQNWTFGIKKCCFQP